MILPPHKIQKERCNYTWNGKITSNSGDELHTHKCNQPRTNHKNHRCNCGVAHFIGIKIKLSSRKPNY